MEISPIPADIIRRIIAIGDRKPGGLLSGSEQQAMIPLSSGDYNFEVSNSGLIGLSNALMDEIEIAFEELEKIGSQELILGTETLESNLDIEPLPIKLEIPPMEMPMNMEISDTNPIEIGVRVSSSSLTIALLHSVEDEVKISLAPATIEANPLASALTDLGLEFSDYGVSSESAIFYSVVPPIMEYTLWGLIKSSARLEITMPDSIRINHFESEKGLGSVGVIDGLSLIHI